MGVTIPVRRGNWYPNIFPYDVFSTRTSKAIVELLQNVGMPCGPINTVAEALTSEQGHARGAVVAIGSEDAKDRSISVLGNPLKFSRTAVRYDLAPHCFGADTAQLDQILTSHRNCWL